MYPMEKEVSIQDELLNNLKAKGSTVTVRQVHNTSGRGWAAQSNIQARGQHNSGG